MSGLFKYQPIRKVQLLNESEEIIASRERPPAEGRMKHLSALIMGRERDYKAPLFYRYDNETEKETKRLEDGIAQAKASKDADRRKALQKELREYLKQMDEKKADESRQLLKERFDYSIFMYEAEKVGISATGGEDENELYPNPNQPKGVEKTCVEWYREFLADPKGFVEAGGRE